MRILVCGCNGQLGSDCVSVLKAENEVMGVDLPEFDITDADQAADTISSFKPDIILNCAAFTAVDACETEQELAWKVNADGPGNLAFHVEKNGGVLIHISTDYVFDGEKNVPEPYLESDKVNPLSYYGRTKLEGEQSIISKTDRYIILRTAWLYGFNGANFLKTILKLALKDSGKEIKVVNDQFGSPTWSRSLALQVEKLVQHGGKGIYHATDEGYCSWYEFATYFLRKMKIEHPVVPCTTEEYPTRAVRPRNSILENQRLKKKGINCMPDWRKDIDFFVTKFSESLMMQADT